MSIYIRAIISKSWKRKGRKMNKMSGLAITLFVFGLWMSVLASPRNDVIGSWGSLLFIIAGGVILIRSLPFK